MDNLWPTYGRSKFTKYIKYIVHVGGCTIKSAYACEIPPFSQIQSQFGYSET